MRPPRTALERRNDAAGPAVDLGRVRAAGGRLDALATNKAAARAMDAVSGRLRAGDPSTLATLEHPMPKLRDPATMLSEPFTLRVGAPTIAALDALAGQIAADPARSGGRPVNRQAAGRMALERGIRALVAELAGESAPPGSLSPAALPSAETVAAAAATLEALADFPHDALLAFVRLINGAAGAATEAPDPAMRGKVATPPDEGEPKPARGTRARTVNTFPAT